MKKLVGLWALLWSSYFPAWCQIDTTYVYNTSLSYGTLDIRIAKSPTRYYYLQEDTTFSFREDPPGVKTYTYRDMTSWDSSPFREGNLREKNGNQNAFVMNYRLLIPKNYNPSYDPGYPIIIMFHGLGERGNCWDDNCYWSTTSWSPTSNNPPAPTSATSNLLNNDHNLLHGGSKHLSAVNLAGAKLPNDPTLASNAFPGFVVFPQNLNGWGSARVEDAIRILRLIIKKYKIDKNRVYVHGLSNGGGAAFQALKRAPWLFAAAAPMSAVNDGGIVNDGFTQEVGRVPLWIFQGGQDTSPSPGRTYNTVRKFEEAGASVRYYLYENLGHGTWNTAYNEHDFFSWLLSKRKYEPHIYYGNPVICNSTGAGVRISFSNGFPAYQWEHDGELIANLNQSEYTAMTPGTYRGRFSRKANPAESDWEPWSSPVVVTEVTPAKPQIDVIGTTHLRGPGLASANVNNTAILKSKSKADLYTWYKNGSPINFGGTDVDDTLRTASFLSTNATANGTYTLVNSYSYCPSPPSDPVYLFFNNSAPENIALNATQVDLKGVAMSSGVFLTWNDLVSNELGYEIWRKKSGTADFKFAACTSKDAVSFFDGQLEPNTTYLYKIRAVSSTGASNYIPSNTLTINYEITTLPDTTAPAPPQELTIKGNTINSVTLSWKPATDNTVIREYRIEYGASSISTVTPVTTFTITGLTMNTTFPVVVKAIDYAGNVSAASNQVIGSTYVLGLSYKHSTGAWQSLDDPSLVATFNLPEFTGTINTFSLAPRTQEDFFNFEYNGYINIRTAGKYLFLTRSDDGSRLFLDGNQIVNNDGIHGGVNKVSDTLNLSVGPHPIKVQYFEYASGQSLVVQYKGPELTGAFVNIPDSLLRSAKYTAPAAPAVPQGLMATTAGMKKIDLSWQLNADVQVEIYRSSGTTGVYAIVGRSATATFADTTNLIAGTTYYYKAKAVASNAVSALTPAVSATTGTDDVAPSVPVGLQLTNQTHTQVTFTWTASTDNTGVTAYEIFSNGMLAGTSQIPAYTVNGLLPNASYDLTVKALDASGNRSAASATLQVTTNAAATYYSLATGDLNATTTWKQNANGTGNSPEDFSINGQFFIISNRTQASLSGAWDISGDASKVVVPTGVTLTLDNALSGNLELEGTATLNLNHDVIPALKKISASSTINFNGHSIIPKHIYGNLMLSGTGIKTFEGDTTTVLGNLSVGNGITLKGNPGNASLLVLHGNLSVDASAEIPAADNRIDLKFTEGINHTVSTGSDLFFYRVWAGTNASVNISSSGSPVKLVTGSLNGGGLKLEDGSTLSTGNGSVQVVFAGTVNTDKESGRISISEGSVKITSTSDTTSNLYFDPSQNLLDSLSINMQGSGNVIVRNDVKVATGLKVKTGTLDGGGHITLLSTATKTAYIGKIENEGSITGAISVEQYLEPLGESRRDLSVAVSNVRVADWQNYFPVTGPFTGSSGGVAEPSMFISNGTGLINYPANGSTNQAILERGKGYQVKINQTNAITTEVSGIPFQGTVSFALQGGWNLVGNPYASPVEWSDDPQAWTRSGISATIAVKENKVVSGQSVGQYIYYNPTLGRGTIRAGQGFWVQATTSSPALSINENAKTVTSSVYPQIPVSVGHLVVSLNQGALSDKAYILFAPEATDAFDNTIDGLKKLNEGMFSISSLAGSAGLAVNNLSNNFCSKAVHLDVQQVSPGNYSLTFEGIQSLAALGEVTLTDHFTNTTVAVSANAYSFGVTDNASSYGSGRFTLTFTRYQLDANSPQLTAVDVCGEGQATVTVEDAQAGVEYFVLNADDEIISEVVEAEGEFVVLHVSSTTLASGNNHIRVRAGFPGCNTRLLVSEEDVVFTPEFSITATGDVSVCYGDQAMLQASGVPQGGHYRWLDENNVLIDSVTDGTLLTNPVLRETIIHVGGVMANGCESDLKTIHLYADTLEVPVITLYNDTLFVQAEGNYQWIKNGSPISGATKPYYVPSGSGVFEVMLFRMGCSKQSATFEYIVDPGCQVNTTVPSVSAADNCGSEVIVLTISNSQEGVIYSALSKNDEIVSLPKTGTGGTITLEVSTVELDSGSNTLRVKADLEGCSDRVLNAEATFLYFPPMDKPLVAMENNMFITSSAGTYQWKKDGEIIEGATLHFYQPQASGMYSVMVTQNICSVESDAVEYTVTVTGIEGIVSEFVLNTYPVPATGSQLMISVQSPRPEPVFVQMVDITGRIVFQKQYRFEELSTGLTVTPETGMLMDGVYCVIAVQGGHELRKRIVIKN